MRKRKLSETFEMQLVVEPNVDIVTDNMVSQWGSVPYPELSVLLVHLKFLASVHQTHHWTAKGDPYYSDHLLFERLYDAVAEEIDGVAEKAIGLGSMSNVDLNLQTTQVLKLVKGYGMTTTINGASELARRSYVAEMGFLKATGRLVTTLRETGSLTRGLDNMIAGIEDVHEGHVYLLKQRIS